MTLPITLSLLHFPSHHCLNPSIPHILPLPPYPTCANSLPLTSPVDRSSVLILFLEISLFFHNVHEDRRKSSPINDYQAVAMTFMNINY